MATPYNSYNASPNLGGTPTSPRRRQLAVQPPNLLTASLENARNAGLGIGGHGQTPVSTTSLSSPFSGFPQSPAGAVRGASPMALRSQASFSGTYNPQQWGPLSNSSAASPAAGEHRSLQPSRNVALAPRPVGPDEPVASPPPPYSPRREPDSENSPRPLSDAVTPSDTVSPDSAASRYGTPISAATTLSPDLVNHYHTSSPSTNTGASSFPPPPPAQGTGQRKRTFSRTQPDRLLSSITSRGKAPSSVSPLNANDSPRQSTMQDLTQSPESYSNDSSVRAPAARRAASTGAIGIHGGSFTSSNHAMSPSIWEQGMPLPPPPPGPPPAGLRSQSLNRPTQSPSNSLATTIPFRQRRPPGTGTALDTVPPTPADWKEETAPRDVPISSPRPNQRVPSPLHIDTTNILQKRQFGTDYPQTTTVATPAHKRRDSSMGGLSRTPAVRDRSAKGIRERRSESRNGKGRALDNSAVEPASATAPWDEDLRPVDLILTGSQSAGSRQRVPTRISPKSGRSMQSLDGAINSAELRTSSGRAVSFASSHTTPQPESAFSQNFSASTSTPPFSPGKGDFTIPQHAIRMSPSVLTKSTLSSSRRNSAGPALSLVVPPTPEQRPISHILHIPNPKETMQIPLTPSTRAAKEAEDLLGPESPKAFAGRANERHRIFAECEAAAANDSERLDLFMRFMVAESRIRREQYPSVFEDEDIDIEGLTKALFGRSGTSQSSDKRVMDYPGENGSKRTSIASSTFEDSSSQGDVSAASRMHESPSSATSNSSNQHRPESNWQKDYVPSLSPIASMSITTGQDEMDSRGRAPSRWWEDRSYPGDGVSEDAFNVLGRSKRESKYMGVTRNIPAVYEGGPSSSTNHAWAPSVGVPERAEYGHDEYPPEKVGWHEEAQPALLQSYLPSTPQSAPPDPRKLDISRLVTLPPPYPRHHPAVNNNHPELADTRAIVRSLNQKDEPDSIKEAFESQIFGMRQRAESWCKHQRSLHRQDIEFRMEHGDLNQEQYDEAEIQLEARLHRSEKEVAQEDFDLFQSSVLTPLHAIFSDRVKLATSSLDQLSSRLFSDAQSRSPNLPQEEGDEQPELLEKLTQLKWLFEARESLHRQIYDLLSQRNDRYKAIVLLPFKQSHNHEKQAEAERFFAQDAQDRRIAFDRAVLSRAQAFLHVVEANVTRGVEVQLDAFWEIAPSLLDILHKIPADLHAGFEIQIPATEYDENPSYHAHPLQYLYSLLGHAEKSSYQFIESQINLLCLLHEIRCHTLSAECRVEAADDERKKAGEEKRLTEDLKEKVGVVEGQWGEALGGDLLEARERVRGWLLETGGFDEEEDV